MHSCHLLLTLDWTAPRRMAPRCGDLPDIKQMDSTLQYSRIYCAISPSVSLRFFEHRCT
jgi:hypothetical protein